MSANQCGLCGQAFRATAGHHTGGRFGGCCRSFRGSRDFDLHRAGEHQDGSRRCLTDAELLAGGWVKVDDILPGLWASPETQSGIRSGPNRMTLVRRATEATIPTQWVTLPSEVPA